MQEASLAAATPETATDRPGGSLFAVGRNCWRVERADRLAFLIDGEAYFGAVRSALAKARRSIFILGWDIDSRVRLVPKGANDGFPEPLGAFLNAIVAGRRGLRGYVLSWDFAMLYAMEREWLPVYKLDWRTHRRLSFRLDDQHPVGASQHQKLVVVDDAVAFVSGFDLTRVRWDTSEHACDEPGRVDHDGSSYAPFHDVGIVVGGDCARALGELARERWTRASGDAPRRSSPSPSANVWPEGVEPELTDVDVAISRTEPAFGAYKAVSEIRELYVDAIAAARHCIFAENQYFTSRLITEAFARRLREDHGPEIAVISPFTQSGWLEISTMGVLRGRNHRMLRAADTHGRYRLYAPTLPWLDHDQGCLNVHSKVLTVDDEFAMIGSANMADRSLGTDTECNLAFVARGEPRMKRVIAALRERLLAEHLGRSTAEVAEAIARTGSLHRVIDELARKDHRTLKVHEPALDPRLDALVPDHRVLDPEQPIDPDNIVADLVPHEESRSSARARLIGIGSLVVALALMALAWRFTPLQEWLALDRLIGAAEALRANAWAPLAVLLAYIGGALIVFPLTLLIAVTAIVFGPWLGIVYALVGATSSAALTFAIGRHLGRETVRTIGGRHLNEVSRRLGERGLVAVIFARMLPLGPFSIVNIVAGASHIRWRDFLLGTVIGLIPGVTMTSFFIDRAAAAILDPGPGTFALLGAVAAAIVAFVWVMRKKLRAREAREAAAAHGATHGS